MKHPFHQKALMALFAIGVGILFLGNILDAVNNAYEVISLKVSIWVSSLAAILFVCGQIYLRRFGLIWVSHGSKRILRGLGLKTWFGLLGVLVLLWIPQTGALHDRGVLDKVKVISAVSGGAVIAGLYAYKDQSFESFDKV